MKTKSSRLETEFSPAFKRSSFLKSWLHLLCLCFALLFHHSSWAFVVDNGATAQQMAECIMGPGITVNNAVYTGAVAAHGLFSSGTADGLEVDHGVVLTTGDINFLGRFPGLSGDEPGSMDNGANGDTDMTALTTYATFDAAVLEFDIVTSDQTVSFDYVFASNAYTDFIGINDPMAIFIDQENIAFVPGTEDLISASTINPFSHSEYYVGNESMPAEYGLLFDGFTTKLTATKAVTAGIHHVKIVICDIGNSIGDSAVFIEGSCTIVCNPPTITRQPKDSAPCIGATVTLRAEAAGTSPFTYQWKKNGVDVVDGYTVSGSIFEGATTATLSIGSATSADDGEYQLFVANPCGNVASQIAVVSVENGRFVAAEGGYVHQLFLRDDGILWAAGNNVSGQLGTAVGSTSSDLVQVANITGVTSMAAGGSHSLAIVGGAVWAWGANGSGRLGDGTTTQRNTPVPVSTLSSGVTAVSAGNDFSLALKNGNVWAWGNNSGGKLGDGTTVSKSTPVQLPASAFNNLSVTKISAGALHSLAITSDGIVWAWGSGYLGNNSTVGSSVPVALPAASFDNQTVIAISAGSGFSLALTSDGRVWSWGYNAEGECGNGTTVDQLTPTDILTGAVAIAAGGQHALAAMSDGSVQAWGANGLGQLGQGATSTGSLIPITVNSFGNISGWNMAVLVAAGASSSLVVTDFNSVFDWGVNTSGMLGDGTTVNRPSPVLITPAGPPHINSPIQNPTVVCPGSTVTLKVKANGSDLLYKWDLFGTQVRNGVRSSGAVFSGVGTDTLTITGVTAAEEGVYAVYLVGSCGITYSVSTLIVGGPKILTQPNAIDRDENGQHMLKVTAAGSGPLTYQWYRNGVAIAGSDATSATYIVPLEEIGEYYVIVSNPCGTAQSDTVPITALINIQFGEPASFKTGKAAMGDLDDDYWNTLPVPDKGGGSTVSDNLLDARQATTSITLTVDNADAGNFGVANDPLLNSYYNVPLGGQMDITINNLPMGTYDIYFYGISGPFGGSSQRWNAEFSIVSGVGNPPAFQPLVTSPGIAWDINSWVEGNQYVVFRDLHTIGSYAPVVIAVTADASHSFIPYVNGLQIVRKH